MNCALTDRVRNRLVSRARQFLVWALVAALGSTGLVRGPMAQAAGDTETAATLIRGAQIAVGALETLQGLCYCEWYYEPDTLEVLSRADAEDGPPPNLVYAPRGLHQLAFWLDFRRNRWRIEVAELASTGMNEWGFPTNYAMRQDPGERAPVLVRACDGSTITSWDTMLCSAKIVPLNPDMPFGGGYARSRLQRLLLLGEGWHPEAYSLAGKENVSGVECHKLVRETSSDEYLGKVMLWIAPERGYSMMRYVGGSVWAEEPKRGMRRDITVVSVVQVGDGIWLPQEVRQTSYSYVPDTPPRCTTCLLRLSELQANVEIPDFRYQVQLPIGTVLHRPMAEDPQGRRTVIGQTNRALAQFDFAPLVPEYDEGFLKPLRGDEFTTTE